MSLIFESTFKHTFEMASANDISFSSNLNERITRIINKEKELINENIKETNLDKTPISTDEQTVANPQRSRSTVSVSIDSVERKDSKGSCRLGITVHRQPDTTNDNN